jgi:hypothetical protein
MHWWPDRKVRHRMIIPLTMILTFWILSWWRPGSLVEWASCYRCTGLTQGNQTIWFGIPNGSVFTLPDVGPAFLVLIHEDVKGDLWVLLWLAPLILLSFVILQTFCLDHWRTEEATGGRAGEREPNISLQELAYDLKSKTRVTSMLEGDDSTFQQQKMIPTKLRS